MNNPVKKEVPAAMPLQNTKVFPNIKVTIFMKEDALNNVPLFHCLGFYCNMCCLEFDALMRASNHRFADCRIFQGTILKRLKFLVLLQDN